MSSYLRPSRPGSCIFFTARAAVRGTDLFVREIELLRHATRKTRARYPFEITEIVVLGDVIHTLWTMPEDDGDFSIRWRMLKSLFSRGVPAPEGTEVRTLRLGEKGVWQRRFWEHAIRDADDLAAHRHMIYSAPVQAGLVRRPEDWPHSSIHRAMARGQHPRGLPTGWAYRPAGAGRTTGAPYATVTA
ncbi:MAG: transposase [Pseudomonadota bacterium]